MARARRPLRHAALYSRLWRKLLPRGGATRTAEGESANVLSVGRVYFNEDNGHDLLTQYGTAAFDDEHTKRGYLALAAAVRAADAPGFLSLAAQIALAPCCCGIE